MKTFTPSFLDMLIDGAADTPGMAMTYSLEQVKESVARDVEALLNTRSSLMITTELPPQVRASIMTFGLVDISAMSLLNPDDRNAIRSAIETAIAVHDRRFMDVRVELMDGGGVRGSHGRLQFTIHARLRLSLVDEPVRFDAVLDPGSATYTVYRQDGRARRTSQA